MTVSELSKARNNKKLIVLIALLCVIVFGVVGWYVFGRSTTKKVVKPSQVSVPKTTPPKTEVLTKPPAGEHFGTIQGVPAYPGGTIPADEMVCAENIDNHKTICTKVTLMPKGNYIYALQLPVGPYNVYATATNEAHKYRAYYDQYVVCGMKISCPATGHKDIVKVSITDGSKATDINPNDWADPAQAK